MKLRLNRPELADELVRALNATECLAARTAADTVDVFVPWLAPGEEQEQAETELLFFVHAWTSAWPGLRVLLETRSRS